MSYAKKARAKAAKLAADEADPERRNIRNAIRRGKAPRYATVQGGVEKKWLQLPGNRMVKAMKPGRKIVSTFGMILDTKTANANKSPKE